MTAPNAVYGEPSAARTGLVCRVVVDGAEIDCSKPTPIPDEDIDMGGHQRDADGRGLTILETRAAT